MPPIVEAPAGNAPGARAEVAIRPDECDAALAAALLRFVASGRALSA